MCRDAAVGSKLQINSPAYFMTTFISTPDDTAGDSLSKFAVKIDAGDKGKYSKPKRCPHSLLLDLRGKVQVLKTVAFIISEQEPTGAVYATGGAKGPWFLAVRLYHSCCAKPNIAQNHTVHKIPLKTI